MENYEGIPSTTDNNANKDVQESANKDDGQERDNTNKNTKMFKHITAITCVIKPLVDCFLKNLSPVIYLDASFCSNYGKLLSAMFMDANHHIQPIACHFCGEETGVDYTLLLTALMEAGLNERKYLVFNSDGSKAINMAITSVMKEFNITNYRHVICSQHIFRHVTAKLLKDEKVSSETDEGKNVYKELKKNYWTGMLVMLELRKCV